MADLEQGELTRCYCGNVGRMQGDLLVCNQCIAQGREGAPWPGDYYKKTGLFADRSREFNPSIRVRPAHHGHPKLSPVNSNNYVTYPSSQEIDTLTEMYGNIILKSRVDLADLCDLYSFRVFVEVGTNEGVFAKQILERSSKLRVYCVDHWQPFSEYPGDRTDHKNTALANLQEYIDSGRATILEMLSVEAPSKITEGVDIVYIDASHDSQSVMDDLNSWYPKLRVGGILAGHDYNVVEVKMSVRKFAYTKNVDIHVIKGVEAHSWFLWKRS